jgi:hypothetical protein
MKTKGNFRFSAAHSNLTTLQTNTNAAQAVRSITLAQQLKRSSPAPTNHNNRGATGTRGKGTTGAFFGTDASFLVLGTEAGRGGTEGGGGPGGLGLRRGLRDRPDFFCNEKKEPDP